MNQASNAAGKLEGKVALITGAGSGMGRAMAREFSAQGAAVVATDVSDSASVNGAVGKALEELGQIDVLCSNAGVLDDYATVLETDEADWDRVVDINLKGMYLTAKAVLPQMIENGGGAIVNTAFIHGAAYVIDGGWTIR